MAAAAGPKVASVGNWVSPITSKLLTSSTKRLGGISLRPDGRLFWLEARPTEKGRQVLVTRAPDGKVSDVTPPPDSGCNVRTRVHEYGGGDYTVSKSGAVYWSNFADQRLYAQEPGPGGEYSAPRALSPDNQCRFADAVVDEKRSRLVAVGEDHSDAALKAGGGQPINAVVSVDLGSGEVRRLVEGRDFYSSPRLSPDAGKLAWVCWDHPNMPWDDTELWVGDIADDGSVVNRSKVAGGVDESVMQPQWGPDGSLYFISDAPSGWWNIFKTAPGSGKVEPVFQAAAEVGGPAWLFGSKAYHVLASGAVLAIYSDPKRAGATLALVDLATRAATDLPIPYSHFGGQLAVAESADGGITLAAVAGSSLAPTVAIRAASPSGAAGLAAAVAQPEVVARSTESTVDRGYLSQPQAIEFPTEGGKTAFMNYYPPKNKDYVLPLGELPPLLVKIHGGPTSQASTALALSWQYWTSRGFAVADVNYGGSTGYGREFRMRLRGQWGVVDVDDCCNAARHLAAEGRADPARLCIDGGSAGGYTTLACLAFRNVFAAGASHYGVADLELLAKETHKFESRYLDGLVGKYPEDIAVYKERSPINHVSGLDRPTAFFQGLEDKVVPPNQAELMHERLRERGVATALVLFEGEQHGFRQAPNIRRALDGELYFYGRTLGFPAAMPEDLDPIHIDNLS